MEFGLVRLFLVVALAPQQRGEGGASTSGKQLGPTDVDIHDYLNSMLKCSMKVVVRQPRYPDVATAGHAKAALRQFATVGRT
ncbi:MAG: hypothetical protein DMG96_00155 [Acidobacteria bacterium]|nr:MAG: hypothetical protein DMG96_00155 [Acidobacteriota bacterium]